MYQLFLLERYDKNMDRDQLIVDMVRAYGEEYHISVDTISKESLKAAEKDKPYFEGSHIHFSISHSKGLLAVLVGQGPCGVDLQLVTDADFEKIAKRHFKESEVKYVDAWGEYGFFTLWTMREAFGKFTGQGFYGDHPDYVSKDGKLLEIGNFQGKPFRMTSIDMGEDLFCACCTNTMDEINVVFLN